MIIRMGGGGVAEERPSWVFKLRRHASYCILKGAGGLEWTCGALGFVFWIRVLFERTFWIPSLTPLA